MPVNQELVADNFPGSCWGREVCVDSSLHAARFKKQTKNLSHKMCTLQRILQWLIWLFFKAYLDRPLQHRSSQSGKSHQYYRNSPTIEPLSHYMTLLQWLQVGPPLQSTGFQLAVHLTGKKECWVKNVCYFYKWAIKCLYIMIHTRIYTLYYAFVISYITVLLAKLRCTYTQLQG